METEDLLFGLIGFPLGHSFSRQYYDAKIAREKIRGVRYELLPLRDIRSFPRLLADEPNLAGLNVTIPHKIDIVNYLDRLSEEAQAIGAVNCIRIVRDGRPPGEDDVNKPRLWGYNTDAYGFEHSLLPLLESWHYESPALVLGNGGAARAVHFVLAKLGIASTVVSRSVPPGESNAGLSSFPAAKLRWVGYRALDREMIEAHPLIINTTPLGMHPEVETCPDIPYEFLGSRHLLYDLVYNPLKTRFLERGEARGAKIKNGMEMLELQAERNWEIWTMK